jgi:hypothetical protein
MALKSSAMRVFGVSFIVPPSRNNLYASPPVFD